MTNEQKDFLLERLGILLNDIHTEYIEKAYDLIDFILTIKVEK
jgi:hypothetical protein